MRHLACGRNESMRTSGKLRHHMVGQIDRARPLTFVLPFPYGSFAVLSSW